MILFYKIAVYFIQGKDESFKETNDIFDQDGENFDDEDHENVPPSNELCEKKFQMVKILLERNDQGVKNDELEQNARIALDSDDQVFVQVLLTCHRSIAFKKNVLNHQSKKQAKKLKKF